MRKLLWVLFYILIFCLLVHNSFSYLDPDFGWHLRFGELIWQTKSVPHDQIFLWALPGKTWVDHEWLGNLALYGLWQAGGYLAVTGIFALLPLLTLALINRHLLRFYIKKPETMFLLGALEIGTVLAMQPHFGVRLQELTFLGLSCVLILWDRFRHDGNPNRLWWLVPLLYIWSMSHAGFLMGLVVSGAWAVYQLALLQPAFSKLCQNTPLSRRELWSIILIFAVTFIATLLTPYGPGLYGFLGDYRNTYYMAHIQEWLPPYAYPIHYAQMFINCLAIITTLGTLFFLRKRNLLGNALLVLFFSLLAFRSVRHFPLLVAAWLILIIPHCLPELTTHLRHVRHWTITVVAMVCVAVLSFAVAIDTKITNRPFAAYCGSYPCAAITFLRAHPQYLNKIFNHYNFGGFIIGLWPEARLFADGRLPQYPLAGVTLLEEYNSFNKAGEAEQKLDYYDIQTVMYRQPFAAPTFNWFERYILGYREKDFTDISSPLLEYLKTASHWKKVYEDSLTVIFVRL